VSPGGTFRETGDPQWLQKFIAGLWHR